MMGQNFKKHQWKNRLLVIYTNSEKSELYQKQIALLKNYESEINDRKIVVYTIIPDFYSISLKPLRFKRSLKLKKDATDALKRVKKKIEIE